MKRNVSSPFVLVVFFSFVVALTGCGKREASGSPAPAVAPPAAAAVSEPSLAGNSVVKQPGSESSALPRSPALVTTVDVTLSVASVVDATARVRDEVARADGYIENLNASGEGKERRATIAVRIPSARARDFRAAVAHLGETTFEEERVQDVGEERADRKARLANARAEEKRILEILATKTGSLSEVLTAERELARVRETIERFDAQAAALEGQIAMATIRISLVPTLAAKTGPAPSRIATAFSDGFRYASVVAIGATVALLEAGPTLVLLAFVLGSMALVIRTGIRRMRRMAMRVDQA